MGHMLDWNPAPANLRLTLAGFGVLRLSTSRSPASLASHRQSCEIPRGPG